MNNLYLKIFLILSFFSTVVTGESNAQLFHKNPEKQLFGKSRKEVRIKEPSKAHKAKKAQETKDRKMKKDYDKSIKQSQQRTIDIQTPEVKTRMKNSNKEISSRDKSHKRKNKSRTREAGRK